MTGRTGSAAGPGVQLLAPVAASAGATAGLNRGALLILPDDADAAVLEAQLRRLGYWVQRQWPMPDTLDVQAPAWRVLLLPVRAESLAQVGRLAHGHDGMTLGLLDAPEVRTLEKLGALGLHGAVFKPFRIAALQAQLAIAQAHEAYRRRLLDKVAHLETQLRARRLIEHATRILMVVHEIGPQQAYERLRKRAMSQRLTLVEAALQLVERAAGDDGELVAETEQKSRQEP